MWVELFFQQQECCRFDVPLFRAYTAVSLCFIVHHSKKIKIKIEFFPEGENVVTVMKLVAVIDCAALIRQRQRGKQAKGPEEEGFKSDFGKKQIMGEKAADGQGRIGKAENITVI